MAMTWRSAASGISWGGSMSRRLLRQHETIGLWRCVLTTVSTSAQKATAARRWRTAMRWSTGRRWARRSVEEARTCEPSVPGYCRTRDGDLPSIRTTRHPLDRCPALPNPSAATISGESSEERAIALVLPPCFQCSRSDPCLSPFPSIRLGLIMANLPLFAVLSIKL